MVAYCLDESNSTRFDFIRFIDKVQVTSGTKFAHVTELISTTATSGRTVRFEVRNEAGESIDYTVFSIIDEDQKCKSCVILFERQFIEGERYTVVQEEEVDKMMKLLSTHGGDYLTLGLTYAPRANAVEIRMAVPGSFPLLSQQNGTTENLKTLHVALDPLAQVVDNEIIPGTAYETRISGIEMGYKHYG